MNDLVLKNLSKEIRVAQAGEVFSNQEKSFMQSGSALVLNIRACLGFPYRPGKDETLLITIGRAGLILPKQTDTCTSEISHGSFPLKKFCSFKEENTRNKYFSGFTLEAI